MDAGRTGESQIRSSPVHQRLIEVGSRQSNCYSLRAYDCLRRTYGSRRRLLELQSRPDGWMSKPAQVPTLQHQITRRSLRIRDKAFRFSGLARETFGS
jgi:hypothetical protein